VALRQALDLGRPRASSGDGASEAVPRAVRVLVADSRPQTRLGVRLALETAGGEVCAEAVDAVGAVELALREQPDVCLIEAGLPGGAVAATAEIVSRFTETAVVLLAAPAHASRLFAALEAGAIGFLPEDTDAAALAHALKRVAEGEAALPRKLVTELVREFRERHRGGKPPPLRDLSSRELEVLALLHEGLSTAEIARRLFVAPVTVRTHVASILRKLDVPDRRAAAELLDSR
jgi:two-component system nitrate/nitrite response regulator NarL